jgi:hypothetical protein
MNIQTVTALAALVAAGSLLPAAAASAATQIDADRESTGLATQLLADAASARSALMAGDSATARSDIDEALTARRRMVEISHVKGASNIVPLFTELEDSTVLSPAGRLEHGQTTGVQSVTPVTVRSNDDQYTFVAIDLDKAQSRLDAAKLALQSSDTHAAETALAEVGSDLIETDAVTDVPLLTAREDLALAQQALQAKELPAAAADLHQATASLKTYTAPGHAPDARRMADEIEAAMPLNAQSAPSATAKIDAWWSSVKSWFAQHA